MTISNSLKMITDFKKILILIFEKFEELELIFILSLFDIDTNSTM